MQKISKKIYKRLLAFIHKQGINASLYYPRLPSIQNAINAAIEFNKKHSKPKNGRSISVDIGSGRNPRDVFKTDQLVGIDLIDDKKNNVIRCDLSSGNLPFPDESIDYITAFDFIEHLSRNQLAGSTINPFINLMNEVHRILHSGGVFLSHTPAYPFASAFQDPTHTNIITEITFPGYFASDPAGRWETPWASQYGFQGNFILVQQYWLNEHLITVLGKE
jgi:SAM-dependent methyltransferase